MSSEIVHCLVLLGSEMFNNQVANAVGTDVLLKHHNFSEIFQSSGCFAFTQLICYFEGSN